MDLATKVLLFVDSDVVETLGASLIFYLCQRRLGDPTVTKAPQEELLEPRVGVLDGFARGILAAGRSASGQGCDDQSYGLHRFPSRAIRQLT